MSSLSLEQLLRVKALPDEVAIGHAGRLSWMNDHTRAMNFLNACRSLYPGRDLRNLFKQDVPVLYLALRLLAILNRQTFHDYAAEHSMIKHFPERSNPGSLHGTGMGYGLSPQRAFAYLCEDCVRGDQLTFGVSYWHRSHHLVGREYCATHPRSRLRRVDCVRPFDRCPSHWLELGCAIADSVVGDPGYQRWLTFLVEYQQSALDNPRDRIRELQVLREVPRALPDMLMYEMGLGERWEEEGRPIRKDWPRPGRRTWLADEYATQMARATKRQRHVTAPFSSDDDSPSPRA